MDENGNLNVEFKRRISPDQYGENLETVFRILQEKTGARIIWATTTLVPEGSAGRIPGDEELYNDRALEVLNQFPEFQLNDLYTFSLEMKSLQREANVHYFPEGSEKLGMLVAKIIKEHL